MHYTGKNFLQSGLEGNKYDNNKPFNHAIRNHAFYYVTLQNTELAIYHEAIQIAQIKIKLFQECTYVTDKYWPHLNDFLLGQKIINLGPVALGAQLRKKMLGFRPLKMVKLGIFSTTSYTLSRLF